MAQEGLPHPFVGQQGRGEVVLPDLAFEAADAGPLPPSVTVFVGNVDSSLADLESLLTDLFTQMGPVQRVSVPRNAQGQVRGFAFCDFADTLSAQYAVSVLNGLRLGARNLRLELKGGGGGSGGGGAPPPRPLPPLPPLPQTQPQSVERAWPPADDTIRSGRPRGRESDPRDDGDDDGRRVRPRGHSPPRYVAHGDNRAQTPSSDPRADPRSRATWGMPPHYVPAYAGPVSPPQQQQQQQQHWTQHASPAEPVQPMWLVAALQAQAAQAAYNELANEYNGSGGARALHGGYRR
jgi:RNA recognition motif-containing protein